MELDSLLNTGTLRPTTPEEVLEEGKKGSAVAPSKMVFVIKPGKHAETVKHTSRLVVCGNFLPQVAMTSTQNLDVTAMRAMISWGFTNNLRFGSLDVKTAFLNAELKGWNKVLVAPPSALVKMGLMAPNEYWIAQKALYGFKESPKAWEETRDKVLKELEFSVGGKQLWMSQSVTHSSTWLILEGPGQDQEEEGQDRDEDSYLEHPSFGLLPFVPRNQGKVVGVLGVYVDDILAIAPLEVVQGVLSKISTIWDTTSPELLGEKGCNRITYLGVTLEVDEAPWSSVTRMYLHQDAYAHMLLDRHEMAGRPLAEKATPGAPVHFGAEAKLGQDPDDAKNIKFCQQALGGLLWLVTRTRPDLAWAYSVAASMTTRNPREAATRVRHLLGYLKGTMEVGLQYDRSFPVGGRVLDLYADASFAPMGGASHGGSVAYLSGNLLTWKSHRQSLIAMSTAESELIEAADAHLHGRVLSLLHIEMSQNISLVHLACDNAAALTMVGEAATFAWRSRRISIRGFLLSQAICEGETTLYYVGTLDQKADGLTKGLSKDQHNKAMLCWKMTACP